MPNDTPPQITKRSRQACTACRQVKLRCDSMQKFPAPCSRCTKNKLDCRTDPSFRRQHTRDNINKLATQLTAIQQTISSLPSQHSIRYSQEPAALPSLSNSHADSQTTPFHVVDNGVDGLQEHLFCQENNTDNLTDAQISFGTTNIDQGQITLLLNHFEQYYYRHCPIIQTNTSATTLYRSSPFLFWTIIVISSRFHPTLAQLYNALVTPYRLLLGKTLAEPIANLECIQGLVLLCLWPLAVDRQSEDSSWNYCGLVTNAAVRMGLHRETTESRAASSLKLGSEAMAHAKTWMACLKVNATLIWRWASCPHLDIADTTRNLPPPTTLLEADFTTKLQIELQFSKATQLLSKVHSLADMSIIQHLCRDLDDVKDRHRSTWNREADIELLGAQLNIYAFQLQKLSPAQHSSPPGSLEVGTAKKALIHLGLSTAVRIIHVFSTMTEGGSAQPSPQADGSFQTDPHHPERYLPKYYFMTLSFATSFMFKALANNGEDFRHNEIARNHIQLAYQMFSSWSDYPMDEFGRVARMIMVLSRASNLSILEDFHSQGDASVSVLDETIHAAKEIRERMKMPDLTRSTGSQDRIPVSPRPNLSNPTLPGLGGLWPTQNLDGMEEFDFNWNSPWGFNMTALGYPGFGLDEEAC